MAVAEVVAAANNRDVTGESPLWSPAEAALYWVDIRRPAVWRLDPATGAQASWTMPCEVGSIGLRARGGLIVALRSGLHALDTATGALGLLVDPEPRRSANRLNDGKVDPAGRFWVGTVQDPDPQPVGRLYRIGGDLAVTAVADGIAMPNALAFSRDGRRMYFADSFTRRIDVYDFDRATGAVANRRTFATVPDGQGLPDGATVDAEDCLWNARIGGWGIDRYDPDGRLMRTIRLPTERPTSVGFGGPDLATLYITTGTARLDAAALAAQPLAGALLALDPGVRGLAEPAFVG
ncbi:MAG: SMP-30/gluconolactonase/LRE family protein [Rhodospirillales bacterium]